MPFSNDDSSEAPSGRRAGKGNAVADQARRLLMRLATHLNSHALDLSRSQPTANTAGSPIDMTSLAGRGAREREAAPSVPDLRRAILPRLAQTNVDSGTGPLAPHCTVSADRSRLIEDFAVFVRNAPMALPSPPLAHPVIEAMSVASFSPNVRLAGGDVADTALTNLPEKTKILGLPTTPPTFSKSAKAASRSFTPMFAPPKVRPVPERVSGEVALERRRAAFPSTETPAGRSAHLMTRKMLAKAAGEGVGEDDITIVGIYRKVPISAATKMAFDERTNALCLTLRADAARVVQSQGQQIVSIVFGRVRADGRLVRALMPTPNPTGR